MSELYGNLFNRIIRCSVLSPFFRLVVALDCTNSGGKLTATAAAGVRLLVSIFCSIGMLANAAIIIADNMQNENNLMTITIYVE